MSKRNVDDDDDVKSRMFCFTFIQVSLRNKFSWSPTRLLRYSFITISIHDIAIVYLLNYLKGNATNTSPLVSATINLNGCPHSSHSRYDVAWLLLHSVAGVQMENWTWPNWTKCVWNNLNYFDRTLQWQQRMDEPREIGPSHDRRMMVREEK